MGVEKLAIYERLMKAKKNEHKERNLDKGNLVEL